MAEAQTLMAEAQTLMAEAQTLKPGAGPFIHPRFLIHRVKNPPSTFPHHPGVRTPDLSRPQRLEPTSLPLDHIHILPHMPETFPLFTASEIRPCGEKLEGNDGEDSTHQFGANEYIPSSKGATAQPSKPKFRNGRVNSVLKRGRHTTTPS